MLLAVSEEDNAIRRNLFLEVPNRNIDLSIQNTSNADNVEVDSAKTEIN